MCRGHEGPVRLRPGVGPRQSHAAGLRALGPGRMFPYMISPESHARFPLLALALSLVMGLAVGRAQAQTASGDWFADDSGERPFNPAEELPAAAPAAPDGADGADAPPDPEALGRALTEFEPHLVRHGFWLQDPVYGRVWVPRRSIVGNGFVPYASGGHWELTSGDDWLWVSDYPFGWITFHYGRWAWVGGGRWGWVPGYRYAPAWVSFRLGASGYLGWGPLAPRFAFRRGSFVSLGGPIFGAALVFAPTRYVFSRSMRRHLIRDRTRVRALSRNTRPYRARKLADGRVARGPTPKQARISRSALPTRRSLARPRPRFTRASGARSLPSARHRPAKRIRRSSRAQSSRAPTTASAPARRRSSAKPTTQRSSRGAVTRRAPRKEAPSARSPQDRSRAAATRTRSRAQPTKAEKDSSKASRKTPRPRAGTRSTSGGSARGGASSSRGRSTRSRGSSARRRAKAN